MDSGERGPIVVAGFADAETGRPVVEAGLALERRLGARVAFVHAVPPPPAESLALGPVDYAGLVDGLVQARREHAERELQGLLEELETPDPPAGDRLVVEPGHAARVLCERARALGADIVLLGPHRKHGLFDFGSTTRAVLGGCPGAVWMQPGPFRDVRRILAPTDLSEDSLRAVRTAARLAPRFEAEVTVLHAHVPIGPLLTPGPVGYPMVGAGIDEESAQREAEERFRAAVAEIPWGDVPHEERFVVGEPIPTIRELAEQHDLVVMGSHGRTGLARAVLGNVAYAVMRRSPVPILAIRHPEREWQLG